MRDDPDRREPRAPAIVIWTITGLLAGVAISIATGIFPIPIIVAGLIGVAFGFYMTRVKYTPSDD